MFDRLKSAVRNFRLPSIEQQEMDYLNGSQSIHDLERREREVARGMFRNNPYGY